jgi:hypothetical protein
MKPNEKIMYDLLKQIVSRLDGPTPILYNPPDKEHDFNYHFLAQEGYITLFPGDTIEFLLTGRTQKLPCQPVESVTEKGYKFVKEYESRWTTRIHWWWGVVVGLLGLIATVLAILSFFL